MLSITCDFQWEPKPLRLSLTCDGDHGLFGGVSMDFMGSWYPAMHHEAIQCGWKFPVTGGQLCPVCAKK